MDINITEPKSDLDCVFLRNIRIRVFVIEQQIPWQWEFDDYDKIIIGRSQKLGFQSVWIE